MKFLEKLSKELETMVAALEDYEAVLDVLVKAAEQQLLPDGMAIWERKPLTIGLGIQAQAHQYGFQGENPYAIEIRLYINESKEHFYSWVTKRK